MVAWTVSYGRVHSGFAVLVLIVCGNTSVVLMGNEILGRRKLSEEAVKLPSVVTCVTDV